MSGDAAGANATANDGTVKAPESSTSPVNDACNAGQFVIDEDSEEPPNHRLGSLRRGRREFWSIQEGPND